jgi:hypothetical protein
MKRLIYVILPLLGLCVLIFLAGYLAFGMFAGDDQGYKDFCGAVTVIQSDCQKFYVGKKDYPAYSMQQLRKMGAFDKVSQEFLDQYSVDLTPFSSQTPDDKVVLRIGYGPFTVIPWLCDFSITKYEVTHDLSAEALQKSDQLQVTKKEQVRRFTEEHPSWSIVAANAWCQGTTPEESHAELTIAYRVPNDQQNHENHYSFLWKQDDWVLKRIP